MGDLVGMSTRLRGVRDSVDVARLRFQRSAFVTLDSADNKRRRVRSKLVPP